MICDRCRQNSPSHLATFLTVGDRMGDAPRVVQIAVCPDCAAGRNSTLRFYGYFFLLLIAGTAVIALVSRWL